MELYERFFTKEEINRRFNAAVIAIMTNKLVSSKTGLAESLGVKPAKFSEILNGRMNVGVDMIARMCDFYDISPDWLLLSRGNKVFRQTPKQAIWVDDNNLDMKYTECEPPSSAFPEENDIGKVSNVIPASKPDESILYNMYKDEKAEKEKIRLEKESEIKELNAKICTMSEEIGRLKAKLGEEPEGHPKGLGQETAKDAFTKPLSSRSSPDAPSANAPSDGQ